MRTVYYDMNDITAGAVGVFLRDAKVMPAGVTLCVFPEQEKGEAGYAEFAQKDVHFIFSDDVPEIDFYSLPRLDVFARTEMGLLATLGESSDAEGEAPIVLIDGGKNVFRAAKNMMDLLTSTNWKDGICEENEVKLYADRNAAMAENEFIAVGEKA